MSIDKNISKVLDIEPIEIEKIETINVKEASSNNNISEILVYEDQEDFDLVRNTIKSLIEKGILKLDEFGSLASDLETARAFEVYSTMLEKISGLTKDLYDVHHKKKVLREQDGPSVSNINVDKAVFVGTQPELLQHIKKKNGN